MSTMFYWEAIRRAHDEEMQRDPMVFAMGEDIGVAGGTYKATLGLYDKFGPKRIIDTPISENSFVGLGIGAAMIGARPIIEIMSVNFAWLATDQIFNTAAKLRYMSGGTLQAPIVIRSPGGVAHQLGAQHSGRLEKVFMGVSGLRVVFPATPKEAYGMLKSAVRSDDPVVVLEHEAIYNMKGEVPDEEFLTPLEGAAIVRPGRDLTLVAYGMTLHWSLAAAKTLSEQYGIEAEVIDLRSLKPIDRDTLRESVCRTHKVIVVEEDEAACGVGAEIIAIVNEEAFFELDAPPLRVHALDVPIPYNHTLEVAAVPNHKDVIQASLALMGRA